MTYDPLKRDSTWKQVQPGCWIDPAGTGHIFPDEIIAYMKIAHPEVGFEFNREDYDLVVKTYLEILEGQFGDDLKVSIVKHERTPDA